mmetsp:Transcript_26482/g.103150  ORF Transcript_26482/g.103150 Transcript_26482/m.103150 type:complete len:154 (-) Transcript_26482:2039-2500(-)
MEKETGVCMTTYDDLTNEQVAKQTGLGLADAMMAKKREASQAIVNPRSALDLEVVSTSLTASGLRIEQGTLNLMTAEAEWHVSESYCYTRVSACRRQISHSLEHAFKQREGNASASQSYEWEPTQTLVLTYQLQWEMPPTISPCSDARMSRSL